MSPCDQAAMDPRAARRRGGRTAIGPGRERRVARDQVGGLLGEHHHRGVDVAVRDVRHRRTRRRPAARRGRGPASSAGRRPIGRRCPSAPCTTDGARSRRRARPSRGSPRPSRPPGRVRSRRRRVRLERGLAEDPPGDPDRLDPLAPVLVGREVVEAERRMDARIGRDDLHRAAGVGVHRPDVDLVAVAARRRRVPS